MPDIDVTELLSDPDFAQQLTIKRRAISTDAKGRGTTTDTIIEPKPWGVVLPVDTAIGGNALERTPNYEVRGSNWIVHTKFRLRGPADGFQPDVVVIDGDDCVVTIVNSFSHYGDGFIMAEVASMSPTDQPPE